MSQIHINLNYVSFFNARGHQKTLCPLKEKKIPSFENYNSSNFSPSPMKTSRTLIFSSTFPLNKELNEKVRGGVGLELVTSSQYRRLQTIDGGSFL